jgi:hypothetical protein
MDWLLKNWTLIIEVVGYFYLAATALAALTPSNKDDKLIQKIGSILDRIGCKIKK